MLSKYNDLLRRVESEIGSPVYLVGGAVRDALLGRETKDIDLVAVVSPEVLEGHHWVSKGLSFPVYRKDEFPGVELAVARKEKKIAEGHNGFTWTPAETIMEDLERRDFTINAIAWREGVFIHPSGGLADLEGKIIRHVGPAFSEDPLRVFRAARFAAQLGFGINSSTIEEMRALTYGNELSSLSMDRVREEFLKAINSDYPDMFFYALDDAQCLTPWFQELADLDGIPAGRIEHHPEGDTFYHSIYALQYAADKKFNELTRIMALCHDLGKALTPEDMLPKHHGHESKTEPARKMLTRLGFGDCLIRQVEGHIRHHLLPNMARLRPSTVVNYWKATRRYRGEHFDAYHADLNGKGVKEEKQSPRVAQLKEVFTALDNTKIEPNKNVQSIHQQFQRAAATAMESQPAIVKAKNYGN